LVSAAHGQASRTAQDIATTHGYTTAFQVGAIIALLGLIISAAVIRTPPQLDASAPVHVGA
jgi:hypothetical protein